MPMAGEGQRFVNEGIDIPKPLLMANGTFLFLRALKSINIENIENIKYSFVVRKSHIDNYDIDKKILNEYPNANIHIVEKTTNGAIETCLLATDCNSKDSAVLILDCDLEFKSEEFSKSINKQLKLKDETLGGILLSFNSFNKRYSYAKIDEKMNVLLTAEKEVISDHALIGAYYFNDECLFASISEELRNDFYKGSLNKDELYISLLYNRLIMKGKKVKLYKTNFFKSYGTPEEFIESTR